MEKEEISKRFTEYFEDLKNQKGFYDFVAYTKGIGFSIKRDFSKSDTKNTSLLSFYIPDNLSEPAYKKSIIIRATYGPKTDDGVKLRDRYAINSPLDLVENDYCFDPHAYKILRKKDRAEKRITGASLGIKVYEDHIKPTRPVGGVYLRLKLFFWKFFLRNLFSFLSTSFRHVLYILTGDRYSFTARPREEILNGVITDHMFKDLVGKAKHEDQKREDQQSKKFQFFGYETSYWIIRTYSILILSGYLLAKYGGWQPKLVVEIFKNNFLTISFVILSLGFLENAVPKILKKSIKLLAIASVKSEDKQIRI